jgi:predicted DNA-binding transcriptional regulator YafY
VAISTFARRLVLWRILVTTREGLRLRELARRLEVSKNTVQRDLDALGTAGISVLEERRGQASLFRIEGGGGSGVGDGVLDGFTGTPSPPREPRPRRRHPDRG